MSDGDGEGLVALVVPLDTPEARDAAVHMAVAAYIGEQCRFCDHVFESVEDIKAREAVYAGYHAHGRLVCMACWEAQSPEALAAVRAQVERDRRK